MFRLQDLCHVVFQSEVCSQILPGKIVVKTVYEYAISCINVRYKGLCLFTNLWRITSQLSTKNFGFTSIVILLNQNKNALSENFRFMISQKKD